MAFAAAVLGLDRKGNPRTLGLLAALVEAESQHFATAASQPAQNHLVRAFRGGATPTVPVAEFLERIQRSNFLFAGAVYILAGAYLARFMRSRAARDAGILVEPATAHRLVSVAVLLGAKFSSPRHFERRVESFQMLPDVPTRIALPARHRLPHLHWGRRVSALLEGHGARPEGTKCELRIQEEKGGGGGRPRGGGGARRLRACQPHVVAS